MMNLKLFFLSLVFALSLFLVAADVEIDVDNLPPDYVQGDIVTVTVMCPAELSTVEFYNAESRQIYITGGNDQWVTTYNTNSDSSNGRYRLFASCEDGTTAETFFCVDAPGCTAGGGGGGSGGTGACAVNITCSVFSYCNATLQQARNCHDWNNCRADATEVRTCAACEEAWRCSGWSTCQGGTQTRTCTDDHKCGTLFQKPLEVQSCAVGVPKPVPPSPPPAQPPALQKPSFWSQYKGWIIGSLIVLVLAVAAVLFYYLYYKKKHKRIVYNLDELKDWIKKEKGAGTSDNDIKQILFQQTGWKKDEVEQAFQELKTNAAVKQR